VLKEVVFAALESALASAAKKRFKEEVDVRVTIDRETGESEAFRRWLVVPDGELEDHDIQVILTEARKQIADIDIGEYLEEELEPVEAGRIGAQAASVLRRLSAAARVLALPVGDGRPRGVEEALREAGVAAWPKALAQARESLMQLGARRSRQLPVWLMELDRSLKSDASRGLRARLALERLFCKMARPVDSEKAAGRPRGVRS
jgi:hypothetical protein